MLKKKIPTDVYKKILIYKKNKKDISELIMPYSIKGTDLSGTVIKKLVRINENLSGLNLSRAVVGESGTKTILSGSTLDGGNFYRAKFLGRLFADGVRAKNCNFNKSYMPFVSYRNADLRGSTFCSAIWQWGNDCGNGAKFSRETLDSLFKHWLKD